mgnify:CR=1 FL=1
MMRFWDVNEGKINLDNKNIKEVNTASLRNSQTLVSQETYLFNESILDNIKIGNPSASKDEVIQAAKMASIHEFIEKKKIHMCCEQRTSRRDAPPCWTLSERE